MRPPEKETAASGETAAGTSSNSNGIEDSTGHRILLDIPRNGREQLRVSLARFKGQQLVHVRAWYADAAGELQPGKGIALKPEHLSAVIEALQVASSEAA